MNRFNQLFVNSGAPAVHVKIHILRGNVQSGRGPVDNIDNLLLCDEDFCHLVGHAEHTACIREAQPNHKWKIPYF